MTYALPAVEEYEKLLPVAKLLYDRTSQLSWEMLLPLFLMSVAISYSTDLGITGSILIRLKRLLLVALLLVAFPMIAEFCQILGVEIAKSIDSMTGIDAVLHAAAKRADTFSFNLKGLLNLGSDLIVGALVTISFIILVVARFFLLAFQHFYWFLLVALGPFLICDSHNLMERIRLIYRSEILERSLRIRHYGNNFCLFSQGAAMADGLTPVMFNASFQNVCPLAWMLHLVENQNRSRRDASFQTVAL